nr:hypothetical protein [Methylobacillus glycogenes]
MSRLYIAGIVLAALSFTGLYIRSLQSEKDLLLLERDEARVTSNAMHKGLIALDQIQQRNQAAQTTLRQRISAVNTTMASRDLRIQRLEEENEELKLWSNTSLPADVAGLQQHPDFTGAADYQGWLSSRDAMHPASQQRLNQQGTTQSPR